MSTRNVAAAQPTFSDEEAEVLLRTLGLTGNPSNEAERVRLVAALRDIAGDSADARDLVAALEAGRERVANQSAPIPLAADGPFTPIRRRRPANIDAGILADVPTSGRGLSNAAARALLLRRERG